MKNLFYTKKLYYLICLLALTATASFAQSTKSILVPVGGGGVSDAHMQQILALSNKTKPSVLLIPYASDPKNIPSTIEKNAARFKELGIDNFMVLDVSDPDKALELIKKCDIIWMSGGQQLRLRKALEQANLIPSIIERYQQNNIVIAGTSAGASVMSDVMMASSKRDPATKILHPTLSYGLKLWPEAIIDQHFSERKRLSRLKIAIEKNPTLLGIGIDEGTAVAYDRNGKIEVIGKGSVTFVQFDKPTNTDPKLKETVLKAGQSYTF